MLTEMFQTVLGVKMTDEEKMFPKMQSTEQLKTEVWNDAIETIIRTLINKTYVSNEVKIIIRSLKK